MKFMFKCANKVVTLKRRSWVEWLVGQSGRELVNDDEIQFLSDYRCFKYFTFQYDVRCIEKFYT